MAWQTFKAIGNRPTGDWMTQKKDGVVVAQGKLVLFQHDHFALPFVR